MACINQPINQSVNQSYLQLHHSIRFRKSILIHSAVVEIILRQRSISLIMQFMRRLTLISAQHHLTLAGTATASLVHCPPFNFINSDSWPQNQTSTPYQSRHIQPHQSTQCSPYSENPLLHHPDLQYKPFSSNIHLPIKGSWKQELTLTAKCLTLASDPLSLYIHFQFNSRIHILADFFQHP